jgi:beta-glucosidase
MDGSPRGSHGRPPFRDLNKNGRLDPYDDPSRPLEERVSDLLPQITLGGKSGLVFKQMVPLGAADVCCPA